MDFSAAGILARMKSELKNEDTKMEGSFSMDNLQAVSEEIARLYAMRIMPLMTNLEGKEEDMGTSGNERHYIQWAKEVLDADGNVIVGNAKVDAPRDGSGLVYVAVITVAAGPPTAEQLKIIQDYINNMRPVGANPVVCAAVSIDVSILCNVKAKVGYAADNVRLQIRNKISTYLTEIAFQSGVVSLNYYKISSIISNIDSVEELNDLTVNESRESITAEYNKYFALKEMIVNVE